MRIFHVTSEYAPFAKVGGLADAVRGLSRELSKCTEQTTVCLPYYQSLPPEVKKQLNLSSQVTFPWNTSEQMVDIYTYQDNDLTLLLFKPLDTDYFDRNLIYGHPDDTERFLYFCLAVNAYLSTQNYDILHLHDWTCGLLAYLQNNRKESSKIVFTIHNAEHQGAFSLNSIKSIELNQLLSTQTLGDQNTINLMRLAINHSDFITTVSPSYRNDLLTEFFSFELFDVLQPKADVFKGILNGIDYDDWNPTNDSFIPYHYNTSYFQNSAIINETSHKLANKASLFQSLQMPQARRPLVIAITRLTPQKGLDLLQHALYRTLENGGCFILLGSSHDPETHQQFTKLSLKFENHPRVRIFIDFDESLAHKLYAAADISVIPSIFEPCGLTQLISLRYGTLPVVRKTGGLQDSIHDIDYGQCDESLRNGFVFNNPDFSGVDSALDRAMKLWFDDSEKWNAIVGRSMEIDLSWNKPAQIYLETYNDLLSGSTYTSQKTRC